MIELTETDCGVIVPVKAQPGAKRNAIVGEHDGMLKIAVTQKPENGKANEAIIELLAKRLQIAKSMCSVRSGQTGRQKRILIRNISISEVASRLGIH